MVWVEVGHDKGVDRRFLQSEVTETLTDGLSAGIPVGPTVDEEEPTVGLDRIGIDPRR
jgi:hypothetical protein